MKSFSFTSKYLCAYWKEKRKLEQVSRYIEIFIYLDNKRKLIYLGN